MNKKVFLIMLLLMSFSSLVLGYNNTYALVVGVADYKYFSEYSGDLLYTVQDAVSFASFLKSKKGGAVPATNIVLLTDAQASKADIIAKGKALFSKAKKDDRVIFYFSGHGDKGCFLPYDADDWGDDMLFFDDVKSIFRAAKCNTKLLFADACFAGSLKETLLQRIEFKNRQEKSVKSASEAKNIVVMMSCQSDETSWELPKLGHGVFTYYLMEGLGGKANNDGNHYVTIQELYYYLYHRVQEEATKIGDKQTPVLFGSFNMGLIVAKV